jgi:hypothetical protein
LQFGKGVNAGCLIWIATFALRQLHKAFGTVQVEFHGWRFTMKATWRKPSLRRHGELDTSDREKLPSSAFAFPKERKEPLTDANHVRNALARFDQVEGVSDEDRELAFANIKKAAKEFGVEVEEGSWRDLGRRPHTANRSHH